MGIQHYRITVSEIVEVQDEAALIEEFRRFRSENFYPPDAEAFHAETRRVRRSTGREGHDRGAD